ncbi:right-handed parallel beta-helix repeat-containing protein [Flavisolibacter sp. BT320]|nr:right-handed parallel beta-helix repeat-containing protein [Flavisolibacter longurius]
MKTLFVFLCAIFSFKAFSKSYYFSTTGDDSRSSVEAQSQLTPWKSIQKLNSIFSLLKPGDSILFKRGDVFYGSINVGLSGTTDAPIVFSSYGTGERPIITGFSTLSGWKSAGGNSAIWEAVLPAPVSAVNLVAIDGVSKAMGRYPNYSDPNKGYLSIKSHIGSTQINDAALSSVPNFTNGELVIRKNRWEIERGVISQHSGPAITYNTPTNFEPANDFGFFIQNHLGTLDQKGEWYFEGSTNKLFLFFGATNPSISVVKATTIDNVVVLQGRNNITFENLSFQGANSRMFLIQHASNISIKDCSVLFSGFDAFYTENASGFAIQNTTIENANNGAIICYSCRDTYIVKNDVRNVGVHPGMAKPQGLYTAISVIGSNHTVAYNNIDSVGYVAIDFMGDSVLIKNNFINQFGFVKDDGGGIYTWNGFSPLRKYTNRKVVGNIILNGIGAGAGTNSPGYAPMHGIYLDDKTGDVEVGDNTVANCGLSGIYIHNSYNLSVQNNTLYNNEKQLILTSDEYSGGVLIRNIVAKNNILFSKSSNQHVAYSVSDNNDLAEMGVFDRNYYCRPADENFIFYTSYQQNNTRISSEKSLPQWQNLLNQDLNSKRTPFVNPSYIINSLSHEKFKNEYFEGNVDGMSVWSQDNNFTASFVNNKISDGTLQLTFSRLTNTTSAAYAIFYIGSIEAGKSYRLKFDLLSGVAGKYGKAFLRRVGEPYNTISNVEYINLTDTISRKQYIFTANATEGNACIVLEFTEQSQPIWIDNFQLNEANISPVTPDKYVQFVYNPTNSPVTYSLDALYSDMKGNWYNGFIHLQPYTSAVLMKPYGITLPFYFAEFKSMFQQNKSALKWTVVNEDQIQEYEILGSVDGLNFTVIRRLSASRMGSYNFDSELDNSLYYRIKAIDKTGEKYISKTIKVTRTKRLDFSIINPATNVLDIIGSEVLKENGQLSIYTLSGNLVKSLPFHSFDKKISVDISKLPAGTYLANIQCDNLNGSQFFLKN